MMADQSKDSPPTKISIRPHMLDSPESASLWFDIFNGILFIGALLVTVGTWGTIKTAGIKERFSDERIAANEAETKRSIAESDIAKRGAAEANARAAEAKLELEKFKAPRQLDMGQQARILGKTRPFAGTRFDLSAIPGDPEALNFAVQIAVVLEAAGWSWIEFNHPSGPLMTVYGLPGRPNIGQGGAWGVVVQRHSDHVEQFEPAAKALANAVEAEGFLAAAVENPPSESIPNHDTVHIIVGKKT
jgi:hypothetical protein